MTCRTTSDCANVPASVCDRGYCADSAGNPVEQTGPTDSKTDAAAASTEWLALIDEGNYAESWSRSSSQFQQGTTATEWASMATAARDGFGALTSRTLETATSTKELPGAPPGDYYVLDFASVFATKGAVTERVTVVLDGGAWRVAGYFIL